MTRQQNLWMHEELERATDFLAGGTAANHSYKKVFMQYCGAEHEATLREPYLNANYQYRVQNLVCELEQHSQVRKLYIVAHVRSESQLGQLERLKGPATHRNRIPVQRKRAREGVRAGQHACCGMRSRFGHVHHNAKRNASNTTVLYFEVHGDFNAADRAANAPVSAPFTPPVRNQEGRPAPPTRGRSLNGGSKCA